MQTYAWSSCQNVCFYLKRRFLETDFGAWCLMKWSCCWEVFPKLLKVKPNLWNTHRHTTCTIWIPQTHTSEKRSTFITQRLKEHNDFWYLNASRLQNMCKHYSFAHTIYLLTAISMFAPCKGLYHTGLLQGIFYDLLNNWFLASKNGLSKCKHLLEQGSR